MSKIKSVYNCGSCDYQTIKWLGCCPSCNEWDTFAEQKSAPAFASLATDGKKNIHHSTKIAALSDITSAPHQRIVSGISEWDRVLGGGIIPGSFLIVTGDPGIGKSTLLLQVSATLADRFTVLYFSSEESLEQVKLRAQRLGLGHSKLLFSDQAQLESIIQTAIAHKPDVLIIDSIQNCYASNVQTFPGSIGQLREASFHLMRLAKEHAIAVIVSGHINKEGTIAGPKTLEHMVDAVFYLQGEDRLDTRVLRAVKNRFGAVNEIGFFQMEGDGLKEVPNINQHLLDQASYAPGSVLISALEGSRPLLLELQALTIPSKLTMPQRVITGIDHKQVILIAAILEKYLQIKLSSQDIFFKISGGFSMKESSLDLGIALALLSSYFNQSIPEKSLALGEISLTGQIKSINQITIHINEAHKFGIERVYLAKNQKVDNKKLNTQRFSNVYELLSLFT
ncbi:MAG: DNA repair protein RadA [Candidatus Babeliales bacterium]